MSLMDVNNTLIFGLRTLGSNVVIKPFLKNEVKKIDTNIKYKSTSLPLSTPEQEGVSSDVIYKFLKSLLDDDTIDIHNVMIIKNGKIITKAQFGPYSMDYPRYSFSASKSVTSIAIGCLYDEGKLKLSDTIYDILKDEVAATGKLMINKKITIEDVLTMRSTISFNELTTSTTEDWLTGCFDTPLQGKVGKTFNYNSLNTYILSRIVCKLSGKSMSEYLNEKIFNKLGIYDYYWEKCPQGYEIGGWGLYIKHEDFAKLGLLLLNKGKYNGKQLLSEEYIHLATSTQVVVPNSYGLFNYGYQIWVGKDFNSFLFNGMFGQNVCVLPDNNMVIVSGAGIDEVFQQSSYYKNIKKYFGKPIVENEGNEEKLNKLLLKLSQPDYKNSRLMYTNISSHETKKMYEYLDNKSFGTEMRNSLGITPFITSLVSNKYSSGLKNVKFSIKDNVINITFEEKEDEYTIQFEPNKISTFEITYGINKYKMATFGTLATTEDGDFVIKMRLCLLEMPSSKIIKFIFRNNKLYLSYVETPGIKFVLTLIRLYIESLKITPLLKQTMSKLNVEDMTKNINKRFNNSITLDETSL